MVTVAQRIRKRRLELGLSQRAAACEGVSAAHICRLERGDRHPSAKALRALAKRLETSVHWLETGEDDPAHELARLVVDARGKPVPPRARTLAQMILKRASA